MNDFNYAMRRLKKHGRNIHEVDKIDVYFFKPGYNEKPVEHYNAWVGEVGAGKIALYGIKDRSTNNPKCYLAVDDGRGTFNTIDTYSINRCLGRLINGARHWKILNYTLNVYLHTEYEPRLDKMFFNIIMDYLPGDALTLTYITDPNLLAVALSCVMNLAPIEVLIEYIAETIPYSNMEKLSKVHNMVSDLIMKGYSFQTYEYNAHGIAKRKQ